MGKNVPKEQRVFLSDSLVLEVGEIATLCNYPLDGSQKPEPIFDIQAQTTMADKTMYVAELEIRQYDGGGRLLSPIKCALGVGGYINLDEDGLLFVVNILPYHVTVFLMRKGEQSERFLTLQRAKAKLQG